MFLGYNKILKFIVFKYLHIFLLIHLLILVNFVIFLFIVIYVLFAVILKIIKFDFIFNALIFYFKITLLYDITLL